MRRCFLLATLLMCLSGCEVLLHGPTHKEDAPDADVAIDGPAPEATRTGNLQVNWTVNGGDDDRAGRCADVGVDYWQVRYHTLPNGASVGGQNSAFDCIASAWGRTRTDTPVGSYIVEVSAYSGTALSGNELASKSQQVVVLEGAETVTVSFDFGAADF